jgi:iron complex transport system ATP-binding protein
VTIPTHRPAPVPSVSSVLGAVAGRVGYLRVSTASPGEDGWSSAAALGPAELAGAVEAGIAARGGGDRQVVASLLAQSYAFKVGAVSLAAYAIGLPWPSPAAVDVAVRLVGGRATGVGLEHPALGDPGDAAALASALLDEHLGPFAAALREATTIGDRLIRGNVAASCAAAFRAVEGAARDRADPVERAEIRQRAAAFFATAPWLHGAGHFEVVTGGAGDGWFWTRTSCCLYYKESSGRTCDDCSLIAADDLVARRRAELGGRP